MLKIKDGGFFRDLSGLENLRTIDGDIEIISTNLQTLDGLNNLDSINGYIWIHLNPSLTSLTGINDINPWSITFLKCTSNPLLEFCEVESVCNYLGEGGNADIWLNAPGCDSQQEVEDACSSSIQEIGLINALSVTPNPFTASTTLSS